MTDPRTDPPFDGDERATLIGFLDYQRETFALKCADLSPDQLARRAVPPSTLSLLGLARHLADVEKGWTDRVESGRKGVLHYSGPDAPDDDFDRAAADPALVADAFETWRVEVARTKAVAEVRDLGSTFEHERGYRLSIRFLLAHLVEEYARHNGHADLLREAVDGRTGE